MEERLQGFARQRDRAMREASEAERRVEHARLLCERLQAELNEAKERLDRERVQYETWIGRATELRARLDRERRAYEMALSSGWIDQIPAA